MAGNPMADHLNMSVLGPGGGLPQPKRPKLDSTTSETSEVLGKLLDFDNDLPDELIGGILNSTDYSTPQNQLNTQQNQQPVAVNASAAYGMNASGPAYNTQPPSGNPGAGQSPNTTTSQLNMYANHPHSARFAALSNANSTPSPQPTAISTSADPTPTLPTISSTPTHPSSSTSTVSTAGLLQMQAMDSASRTLLAGNMAYSSPSSSNPQTAPGWTTSRVNSLPTSQTVVGGHLHMQQQPHMMHGPGAGSMAMVVHGNPQANMTTMRAAGGGYTSYMGGGGGQYGMGTGGQYPNQIPRMAGPGIRMSAPGMTHGQIRMLANQQHMPIQHVVGHQHAYNPTVHHGPLNANMSPGMGVHQQGMVRQPMLNTMVTHHPPPVANQMARIPMQANLSPGMTSSTMGGIRLPGNPSPVTAYQQDSLLASLEPTLRNPPESPQQQSQVPLSATQQTHTQPQPPQLGQPPSQTHMHPPQSQHNLPSMSQQQSPSPQQPQQPASTLSPQTQNQQGQHQTQPGEFGSPGTAAHPPPPPSTQLPGSQPQTAQLPGSQPQAATQPGGSPLPGLSNIGANQPLTPPQRQPQQQQDMMGQPAPLGGSTTPPNPPAPGGQTSDPEKRKLIQQQLVLLLHAHKCQRREREQSVGGEYRACTLPHCRTMKNVLNHMTECQAGRSCTYPHCASSRQIISHWKNCQRSDCPVCLPLKHPASDRPAQRNLTLTNINNNQLPMPMGGGGGGAGMLLSGMNQRPPMMGPGQPGMLSTPPTAPQYNHMGPPNMATGGNMSYNASNAGRPGGYFEQFNQPSNTGMPADLAQSRISYPVPIPNIASRPTQQWHQHVNPDLRQHLVRKLVEAIYPVQDPMALQDKRVASLIQYAMKVEKAMFETATSREEYYQLLAEKIYRIRKELEERRRVKNEMEKISRMRQGGMLPDQAMVNGGESIMQSFYQPPQQTGGGLLPPHQLGVPQPPQTSTAAGGGPLPFHLPPTPASSVDSDKKSIPMKILSPTSSTPQSLPPSSSQAPATEPKAELLSDIKTENFSPSAVSARNPPSRPEGNTGMDTLPSESLPSVPNAPTPSQVPSVSSVKPPPSLSRRDSIADTPLTSSRPATPTTMDAEVTSSPQMPPPKRSKIQPDPTLRKVFTVDELENALRPVFDAVWNQDPESYPFRQPVDPRALGIPDYFNIIKEPMDLASISRRLEEGEYKTPWEFCRDMWLMFDNAWLYNKKTSRVYKYCTKLTEVFDSVIDDAMLMLGYCCGKKYTFYPQVLYCYGKPLCTIPRDTAYYGYQNSRYVYCPKCFSEIPGDTITVGDDPMTATVVRKSAFREMKNDAIDYEPMVECIHCGREMHKICVLHHENIWAEGFQCDSCLKAKDTARKDNKFSAKRLPTTKLATYLEDRINTFLRTMEADTGVVTIRVVSSSDKILDTRTLMRDRFQGDFPEQFPYRTKAMFVFEEIDGVDVCFFGMHVQEYGSDCQAPNTRRVYISYLDSVHFFRPRHLRTQVYHEILIGYLEFCKNNGYLTAHIWACPPSEGDDYIFHCHPVEQKIPKPKRLIDWYRKMLDIGKSEGVVWDYRDIFKHCTEDGMTSVTEIPYFEGDFWPNVIEENIKELDQEAKEREACEQATGEGRGPKKAGKRSTNKKGNKKAGSTRSKSNKKASLLIGGDDLSQKLYQTMEKHKEVFFVVHLQPPNVGTSSPLPNTTDPDQLINCDLMDGRDAFLTMSREKHWEFSSLRRAKASSMAMLYELHNQTSDRFVYTCNHCRMHVETRYHCRECDDFDLCVACYRDVGHIHVMDKLGLGLDDEIQQDTAQKDPREQRKASIQKCIQFLVHASQCRDPMCKQPSCIKMKRVLRHTRDCKLRMSGNCTICKQFLLLCYSHAKSCKDDKCPVPICARIKKNLREQRAQAQLRQNRFMQLRMINMNQMTSTSNSNGSSNHQASSIASPAPAHTPPGSSKNPTPPSKGSPANQPPTSTTPVPASTVAPSPVGPRSVGKGGPMTPGEAHTPGPQSIRMVASSPSSLQHAVPQPSNPPPEQSMPAPNVIVSTGSGLPGEMKIMRVPQPQPAMEQQILSALRGPYPIPKQRAMIYLQQHPELTPRVQAMARQQPEGIPPELLPQVGPTVTYGQPHTGIPQMNPMAPRPQQTTMGYMTPAHQSPHSPQLLRAQPQGYASVPGHPVQSFHRAMQYPQQRMMTPQPQQVYTHHPHQAVNPVAQQHHHPSQLQAMLRQPTPQFSAPQNLGYPQQAHTLGPPPQYPSAVMRTSPAPQTAGYPQVLGRPMPTHSPLGQHMSPAMHPVGQTQYINSQGMPIDPSMQTDPSFMYAPQPQYGLNSSNNNNAQDGFNMLPPQDRLSRFVENL